jgi:hypothetical protein
VQVAGGIVVEAAVFLIALIFVLAGSLLSILIHATHLPEITLQVLGIIVFGSLYLGFIGYAAPFANGIAITFLEAYKLYFLGGRYPPLGDLLDRSTPPQEPPPPPANYLAYASDTQPPPTL